MKLLAHVRDADAVWKVLERGRVVAAVADEDPARALHVIVEVEAEDLASRANYAEGFVPGSRNSVCVDGPPAPRSSRTGIAAPCDSMIDVSRSTSSGGKATDSPTSNARSQRRARWSELT